MGLAYFEWGGPIFGREGSWKYAHPQEILLDMLLERYQESAATFWREAAQLHAKLLTITNILMFEEKDWKFHASSYLLANQDMWTS